MLCRIGSLQREQEGLEPAEDEESQDNDPSSKEKSLPGEEDLEASNGQMKIFLSRTKQSWQTQDAQD